MTSPAAPLPDRIAIERELGTRSLAAFVRMAWPVVEPNPLRWSWHMGAICEHLEAVSRGEIRDLVICVPPGSSKSLLCSTFWGSWDWLAVDPARRWIAATYAQELSDKNAKLQRDLIRSEWFQSRWGDRVRIGRADTSKVRLFKLERGGWRLSTSVGGVGTGYHADVILGDDLVKAQDAEGRAAIDPVAIEKANDYWFKTLYTRRADAATTRKVLIAQRLHHEDTPGRAIEAGYTPLVLPMEYDPRRACSADPRKVEGELLCPERFPAEVVAQDKITLGPLAHEAQNQQNPTPRKGLLFKSAAEAPRWAAPPASARTIITVDASFKGTASSDYVSIQVWAVIAPRVFLLDNDTRRLAFGATVEAIRAMRERWPAVTSVYIEDKANGPAIVDTLSEEMPGVNPWPGKGEPPQPSKVARAEAVAPMWDAGNVVLPPDDRAPWLGSFLSELAKFPLTKHDDQVDAMTMALLILRTTKHARYAAAVKIMGGG